jgi:hypothetical protein
MMKIMITYDLVIGDFHVKCEIIYLIFMFDY